MSSLFVYGSLMAAQVRISVINRPGITAPAFLPNYHRYKVVNEVYPAILPLPGAGVNGLLLKEVSDLELALLDQFEEGYDRLKLNVQIPSTKETVEAFSYVWAGDKSRLEGTWDFEKDFEKHMESFIESEWTRR
eukprot:gene12920-27253_t